MNVTEDVINRIKSEKIEPKPKWHFLFKESVLWTSFGVAILVGSMSASVVFYTFANGDFGVLPQANGPFLQYALKSLPYIWIVLMAGLLILSIFAYEHTKEGYKHKPFLIWGGSIVLSCVIGAILFISGFGAALEEGANRIVPPYRTVDEHRMQLFSSNSNLLAGKIVAIKSDSIIILDDFDRQKWKVTIENVPPFALHEGMRVGLVGERIDDNEFHAVQVRPWDGLGRSGPLGHVVIPEN